VSDGLDGAGQAFLPSDLPAAVVKLLRDAVEARHHPNRAEAILWSAQAMYPKCLPIYFALYKFYFHRGRLDAAEQATRLALDAAAAAGGFNPDWHGVTPATADWDETLAPQHFYLFSLKALAFIRLRLGDRRECLAILQKLAEIDPGGSVGATVIRDLAAASVLGRNQAGKAA